MSEKPVERIRLPFDVELKVGDTAWFFDGYQKDLTSGEVIAIVERYGQPIYVIEVPTHIDPIYYARDSGSVSDSKDKPIGMWRWVKSHIDRHEKPKG